VRDWERLFVGEIKAGRDPRIKPARQDTSTDLQSVAGFLDAYFERHLRPAGIRSLDTAARRIRVLKLHFCDLAVKTLEEPAIINRFKTESEYSRRVETDLHWHDLRHEGACRVLADGVDIRIIRLMLGHASVQQTQRYLNVTDEELRKGMEVNWKRRTLRAVAGGQNG
jgi:site-specific recombinase XerD